MTPVFLTVDTEFAWRHHAAGLSTEAIYTRSIEPAGVGLSYQLAVLARHRLKACFFVDPMPAPVHGIAPFRRMIAAILDAGQEVPRQQQVDLDGEGAVRGQAAAEAGAHEQPRRAPAAGVLAGPGEALQQRPQHEGADEIDQQGGQRKTGGERQPGLGREADRGARRPTEDHPADEGRLAVRRSRVGHGGRR